MNEHTHRPITYKRTHTRALTHTRVHSHTHTHTHTHMPAHTHEHMHVYIAERERDNKTHRPNDSKVIRPTDRPEGERKRKNVRPVSEITDVATNFLPFLRLLLLNT